MCTLWVSAWYVNYILIKLSSEKKKITDASKWNFNIWGGAQRNKQKDKTNTSKNQMADLSPGISIILSNIYGLNMPIKRTEIDRIMKKQDPIICCL